jgi:hypothetical protein
MRSYFIVDSSCRIGEMPIEVATRMKTAQGKKKPGLGDRVGTIIAAIESLPVMTDWKRELRVIP